MKTKILILLLLFISQQYLYSQTKLDSLKISVITSPKNSLSEVEAIYNLATHYREMSEFDSALIQFEAALQIAQNENYRQILPKIHNNLGNVYFKQSDYGNALHHYRQAVDLAAAAGLEKENTSRYLNIGRVYFYLGDYNSALEFYLQAADNSENYDDELGFAHSSKEIAKIYNIWENNTKAKEYYHRAEQIYEKLGDRKQTAIVLNELGVIFRREEDYQQALQYQIKSLKLKEEIDYKYGIAASLQSLGITYKQMGQWEVALDYYHRAWQIQKEINDEMGAAATISNIGNIQIELGNYRQALQHFNQSNEIAAKIKYNQLIVNNLQAMSIVYSELKDYEQSLHYLNSSIAVKDSLFNQEKHRQFAEMQTKYETVKKERENEQLKFELALNELKMVRQETQRRFLLLIIVLTLFSSLLIYHQYRLRTKAFRTLQEANKVISEQKRELEIMNKTRDRFFSIIAHDLRNSIGSAQMGIELLDDIEELEKEELKLVLAELEGSVGNLSNLLENLLEWARIQIGRTHIEPVKFDLTEMVNETLTIFGGKLKAKNLQLVVDLSSVVPVFADRNMIGSVLQNLLSNAIKFTPENGEIRISEKKDDKNIEISISDSGVGITPEKLEKLFRVDECVSTPGTNSEKGTGLGLILCREFVEKNGGTITVDSQPRKGTTVRFTLPPA